MNWTQELVNRYAAFYLPKKVNGKYSSTACTKPLKIACNILAKEYYREDDELISMISAEISKLMGQIKNNTAQGYWQIASRDEERLAIQEFARFFVEEFWRVALRSDTANIAGNKLALISNTCEFLVKGIVAARDKTVI